MRTSKLSPRRKALLLIILNMFFPHFVREAAKIKFIFLFKIDSEFEFNAMWYTNKKRK